MWNCLKALKVKITKFRNGIAKNIYSMYRIHVNEPCKTYPNIFAPPVTSFPIRDYHSWKKYNENADMQC